MTITTTMLFNASSCKINKKPIDCLRRDRVCQIIPDDEFITFACNDLIANIHIKHYHQIGFHGPSRTVIVFLPDLKKVIQMEFTKLSFYRIRFWVNFKMKTFLKSNDV